MPVAMDEDDDVSVVDAEEEEMDEDGEDGEEGEDGEDGGAFQDSPGAPSPARGPSQRAQPRRNASHDAFMDMFAPSDGVGKGEDDEEVYEDDEEVYEDDEEVYEDDEEDADAAGPSSNEEVVGQENLSAAHRARFTRTTRSTTTRATLLKTGERLEDLHVSLVGDVAHRRTLEHTLDELTALVGQASNQAFAQMVLRCEITDQWILHKLRQGA